MARTATLLTCAAAILAALSGSDADGDNKFFREGYRYVESMQNFYKVYLTAKNWYDAKKSCENEGATLFYPESEAEAAAAGDLMPNETDGWDFGVWVGIFRLPFKKDFKTLDGRPQESVYNRWDSNIGSYAHEHCAAMTRRGLYTLSCSITSPYMCKKTLSSLVTPSNVGVAGPPGMPGVCPVTCPVMIQNNKIWREDVAPDFGSEERPSPAICRFSPATNDGRVPDPYWVMEEDKFPVKCDRDNMTCLILRHNDTNWINENKVPLGGAATGTWLSAAGFSLDHFNTITHSQLQFLREQSSSVRQTVRVYLSGAAFEDVTLRMLNRYDVLVGQTPSAHTPMYYTVVQHHENEVEVKGEAWKFVDLVVVNSAERLPVVDFFVEHAPCAAPGGAGHVSVQLRELCFG